MGIALAGDKRGAAAVELALVTPFMILLLMGVFDFGNVAYTIMEVKAAAFAGAQAGVQAVHAALPCTASTITSAETSATSLGTAVKTTATGLTGLAAKAPTCSQTLYVNTSGSSSTLATTCAKTCPTPAGTYAIAFAQAAYAPLIPWSAFGLPTKISATAVARVQ